MSNSVRREQEEGGNIIIIKNFMMMMMMGRNEENEREGRGKEADPVCIFKFSPRIAYEMSTAGRKG